MLSLRCFDSGPVFQKPKKLVGASCLWWRWCHKDDGCLCLCSCRESSTAIPILSKVPCCIGLLWVTHLCIKICQETAKRRLPRGDTMLPPTYLCAALCSINIRRALLLCCNGPLQSCVKKYWKSLTYRFILGLITSDKSLSIHGGEKTAIHHSDIWHGLTCKWLQTSGMTLDGLVFLFLLLHTGKCGSFVTLSL